MLAIILFTVELGEIWSQNFARDIPIEVAQKRNLIFSLPKWGLHIGIWALKKMGCHSKVKTVEAISQIADKSSDAWRSEEDTWRRNADFASQNQAKTNENKSNNLLATKLDDIWQQQKKCKVTPSHTTVKFFFQTLDTIVTKVISSKHCKRRSSSSLTFVLSLYTENKVSFYLK